MKAAIFDLDGVVLDTESQYSLIWGRIGQLFHPEVEGFAMRIKGMTLVKIFDEWFPVETRAEVTRMLDDFEANEMRYDFIAGAEDYIKHLRVNGIRTALATSSNGKKMEAVRAAHPGFDAMFDAMATADMVKRSKPDPEIFLLAADKLGVRPEGCTVFEDSLFGLQAARAADMRVVGLATTYPAERISAMADMVISNFETFPSIN